MSNQKVLILKLDESVTLIIDVTTHSIQPGLSGGIVGETCGASSMSGSLPPPQLNESSSLTISPFFNINEKYRQKTKTDSGKVVEIQKQEHASSLKYNISINGLPPQTVNVIMSLIKKLRDTPKLYELIVDVKEITEEFHRLSSDLVRAVLKSQEAHNVPNNNKG